MKQTLQIGEIKEKLEEFRIFLYECEKAEATVQKYITDMQTFFRYTGETTEFDKAKILEYKKWLISRYAIRSVNSMLAALNQFLTFTGTPELKVKRIKMQQNLFLHEEKELTRKEFQKLVQAAKREKKEWLALVMETIASTGVRISELKFFTVENVKKGKIEIYNKEKYRKILIPDRLKQKLLCYAKKQLIYKGVIFISRQGKPKDRSLIWKEMKKLKEKTGIDGRKIFPHNLRHLFARLYYQSTRDITGLADLLGHSNMNVTRIYTANTGKIYLEQLNKMKVLKI